MDREKMSSRSLLVFANCVLATLVFGVIAWMFMSSLTPIDSMPSTHQMEVDISRLKPGEVMSVEWEGNDVRILRRTPEQMVWLQQYQPPALAERREDDLPAGHDRRLRAASPEYLVIVLQRHQNYWLLMESRSSGSRCDDFQYTPQPIRVSATITFPGGFFCASYYATPDAMSTNPSFVYDAAGRSVSPYIQPLTVPHYALKDGRLVLGRES